MDKNYYELLEVPQTATQEEIKKSYKKLVKKYHPDFNPGDKEKEEYFKKITEAYETLTDSSKKAEYDLKLKAPSMDNFDFFKDVSFNTETDESAANAAEFFGKFANSFDSIFGDILKGTSFNSSNTYNDIKPNTNPNAHTSNYTLKITFKEMCLGTTKRIKYKRKVNCSSCNGKGYGKIPDKMICKTCKGDGYVHTSKNGRIKFVGKETCPTCNGRQTLFLDPCPKCNGYATEFIVDYTTVAIPSGISDGKVITVTVPGEGKGPDNVLNFTIKVEDDKLFKLDNYNIKLTIPVTFDQLILGASVTVPSLTGNLTLTIPPYTNDNTTFVLHGKGAKKENGEFGNMEVKVSMAIPKNLTEEQKQKISELAEILKGAYPDVNNFE